MPHVTFIHGIGNKPAAKALSENWRGVLADHDLDLDAQGVTSELVYWADLLYSAPVSASRYESARGLEEEAPEIGTGWHAGGDEAAFVRAMSAKVGLDQPAGPDVPVTTEERVLLPWFLKRRLMRIFLRDVHHYLFDAEHCPRGDEKYRIQREIRDRVVKALCEEHTGPHVVVAHSLGSVIAYDCLKRVADCPPVDALLTFGSPLGIDEVQDRLRPEWSRDNGFPAGRVTSWVNVYDPLDPVAGLDPKLGNDYGRDTEHVVRDVHAPNTGSWRHSAGKYLAGTGLRTALTELLEL